MKNAIKRKVLKSVIIIHAANMAHLQVIDMLNVDVILVKKLIVTLRKIIIRVNAGVSVSLVKPTDF